MVACNWQKTSYLFVVKQLLKTLSADYPNLQFVQSDKFYWSPKDKTVYYNNDRLTDKTAEWALLHELSHGVLGHTHYKTDVNLLQLEVEAWAMAQQIAKTYDIAIDEDHIQDCLDTYRDWLHARSKCPTCGEHGLQSNNGDYECLNCSGTWHVSSERFCRPYRRRVSK